MGKISQEFERCGVDFDGAFQIVYVFVFIRLICTAALYQWCFVALVVYIGFASLIGFLRSSRRSWS